MGKRIKELERKVSGKEIEKDKGRDGSGEVKNKVKGVEKMLEKKEKKEK